MVFSLCLCSLVASSATADWQLVEEGGQGNDGYVVFRATPGDSGVVAYRVVGIINAPAERVALAAWREATGTEHSPSGVERKIVKASANEVVLYSLFHLPIVADRDLTETITRRYDSKLQRFEIQSVLNNQWAPPRPAHVVRITLSQASWTIESGEAAASAIATYELRRDPGGSIPRWLVNHKAKNLVIEKLWALRQQVSAARRAQAH